MLQVDRWRIWMERKDNEKGAHLISVKTECSTFMCAIMHNLFNIIKNIFTFLMLLLLCHVSFKDSFPLSTNIFFTILWRHIQFTAIAFICWYKIYYTHHHGLYFIYLYYDPHSSAGHDSHFNIFEILQGR